jgi:OmpA-OmpF porin, OOP family
VSRFLIVGVALLWPLVAAAEPVSGPYVSGGAGVTFATSMKTDQNVTEIDTDTGPLGILAVGWGFGNGLRAELEGSYRSNDVSSVATLRTNGLLEPLAGVQGDLRSEAVLANLVYDIPLKAAVTPYLGVGIGYQHSQFATKGAGRASLLVAGNNIVTAPDTVDFGSANSFAYQAIAGASLSLGSGFDATLEYRFFGTPTEAIPVSRTLPNIMVNGVTPTARTINNFELHDNALLIGFRYRFGD